MAHSKLTERKQSFAHIRQLCSSAGDAYRHLGVNAHRDVRFIRGRDPAVTVELETASFVRVDTRQKHRCVFLQMTDIQSLEGMVRILNEGADVIHWYMAVGQLVEKLKHK